MVQRPARSSDVERRSGVSRLGDGGWPLTLGVPLLGEGLHFRRRPFEFFGDLYKRHGPVVEAHMPGRRLLILGGPEANLFFGLHSAVLSNQSQWQPYSDELGSVPINMAEGESHFARRRFLGQYYAPRTLLARLPEVLALTERSLRHVQAGDRIAIVPLLRALFNDQLGLVLAGATAEGYHEDLARFVATSLGVHVSRVLPPFMLKLPAYVRAKRRVFELSEQLLRLQRPEGEVSLVAGLVAALGDPVLVPDARSLRASVLGPFVAGIHTAAATAVLSLHALSRDAALLSRVQVEVDGAFAQGPPSADTLKSLTTLRYVVMETLRRYPVTAAIQRTLTRDIRFEGYELRAGQLVTIATSASHFLERFYLEPERFDIGRFAIGRQEHLAKGAYAPFGIGPHRCLGASLGELQILVVLAGLLYRLEPEAAERETPRMSFIPGPGPHPRTELVVRRLRNTQVRF